MLIKDKKYRNLISENKAKKKFHLPIIITSSIFLRNPGAGIFNRKYVSSLHLTNPIPSPLTDILETSNTLNLNGLP